MYIIIITINPLNLTLKKKLEGFSNFPQCYDLSTIAMGELNTFRALFLAKKNTQKNWNASMVHTNHFIHGQCTGMNVIQRCLSHLHEPWRGDKHLFGVCQPGLLGWQVRLTMSDIQSF